MGYLTPDIAPVTVVCRALFIPNDEAYLAIVRGLLQELTFPSSWDKFGLLSQQQAAEACEDMFNRFCLEKATCRMIGEIVQYAGPSSPKPEWLVCDGSEVLVADYPDLYAVIADNYGAASANHFRLPDFRDKAASGVSTAHSLGDSYGSADHTLTVDEIPAHNHTDTGHVHTIPSTVTFLALTGEEPVVVPVPLVPSYTGSASANITNTGGGEAFPTVGPRLAITVLIVAKDG